MCDLHTKGREREKCRRRNYWLLPFSCDLRDGVRVIYALSPFEALPTFGIISGRNACPPNPGSTVMIRTISTVAPLVCPSEGALAEAPAVAFSLAAATDGR